MNVDTAAATAPRANLRAQAAFAAVMRLAQLRREPVDGLEIRGVLEGFGAEWTEIEMVEELSRQLNLPMPVWSKAPDDGRLPMLALSPQGDWGVVTARNGEGHWVSSWWDSGERKFREETVPDFAKGHRFARWSVAPRFIASKSPTLRLSWHQRLLRAPLFGRLIRGLNTSRFASTLAILTASGVPLILALDAGAQTLTNDALRGNVDDAISRVREGSTLSRALAAGGQFPPVMIHMIASGEATGELPDMLERTAATLSSEVERRTLALTSLLEPLLILIMGAVVLLIVLAVLLPIIEINQLVR